MFLIILLLLVVLYLRYHNPIQVLIAFSKDKYLDTIYIDIFDQNMFLLLNLIYQF